MMKSQIGLGVLSIPASFDVLGLIPGIICLIAIAAITTWSDYIVGKFKLRHPEVYGIDDAADLMFGRVGKEFFGTSYALCTLSHRPRHTTKNANMIFFFTSDDLYRRFGYAGYIHRSQLPF